MHCNPWYLFLGMGGADGAIFDPNTGILFVGTLKGEVWVYSTVDKKEVSHRNCV
jgi:hypothetical protein